MTWVTSDPSASVKDTYVSTFVRSRWASSSGIACTLAPLIEVLEVAVASRIAGRATVSGARVIVAVACHDQAMLTSQSKLLICALVASPAERLADQSSAGASAR